MTAHTVLASEYVEHAVTTTPLDQQLSPDIQNALESLRKMVRMQDGKRASHESRFAHQKALPAGGVSRLPLPPTDAVVTLLREIKGQEATPQSWEHYLALASGRGEIANARQPNRQ